MATLNAPNPETQPQFAVQEPEMIINEQWAVSYLKRAYQIKICPVSLIKMRRYQGIDLGIANEAQLKELLDPRGKENPEGGKAKYINSDFSVCPLIQSVNGITKSYIINKMADISVRGIDKISKEKKMVERQRRVLKNYAIDTINFIGSKTNDTPFPYSTNLKTLSGEDENAPVEGGSIIEQIKNEMQDDMSFALLSDAGFLKDGVESAHEIMSKYYIDALKFKTRIAPDVVSDIMKLNTFGYFFYTSAMDGTPQVKYMSLDRLIVSPFFEIDSSDKDFWGYEDTVTWSEYMKMIGGKLSPEKNRAIYMANRFAFYRHAGYPEWSEEIQIQNTILNTQINLGYFEIKKHVHDIKTDKYYDKIVKFYYLPLLNGTNLSLKPEYILDLGDLQDMYRFGGMLEYADFSLVLYQNRKISSWYDIMEPSLLRLNVLWTQYLNTATQLVPRGVIFAEETVRELVEEMLKVKREYMEQNGQELTNEAEVYQKMLNDTISKFVQQGRGIFKRRTGELDERQLDPPTFHIEHKLYEDLTSLINQMLSIYNMMIMSLGTNPTMLGQVPKQHQTNKGVELANQAGFTMLEEMINFYEKGIEEFGRRMIYYNQLVIKNDFDSKLNPTTPRAEQMQAIIGTQGVGWEEIGKDMYVQQCTFLIENRPTDEQRLWLVTMVQEAELKGILPFGTALKVSEISNFKTAKMFVLASVNMENRKAVENQMHLMEQQAQQQQATIAQMQTQQVEMMKLTQALKDQNDALNATLKAEGMNKNIETRGQNKMEENAQKADLKIKEEAAKKALESY